MKSVAYELNHETSPLLKDLIQLYEFQNYASIKIVTIKRMDMRIRHKVLKELNK